MVKTPNDVWIQHGMNVVGRETLLNYLFQVSQDFEVPV